MYFSVDIKFAKINQLLIKILYECIYIVEFTCQIKGPGSIGEESTFTD